MTPQQRIRLARRHGALSQSQLGAAVGVQRSAVSHWESSKGKNPNVDHLRAIAMICGVQFEWLVTGRGEMSLPESVRLDSVACAEAMLVEDALEMRLLEAFRDASPQSRVSLVEIVEQLAHQRVGRRDTTASRMQPGDLPAHGVPRPRRDRTQAEPALG